MASKTPSTTTATKKTSVYIDGFNFYYGALNYGKKGKKWLNLEEFIGKMFKSTKYNIASIKFFSARVSGTNKDPNKPIRQLVYFRALQTLPKVEVILGNFVKPKRKIHVSDDVCIIAKMYEEKGTDVNIATHIVNDGHKGLYQTAIVFCNDSDIADAIRIATDELGLEVIIVNPSQDRYPSTKLKKFATFTKNVRQGLLYSSQFPASMSDPKGAFTKPINW